MSLEVTPSYYPEDFFVKDVNVVMTKIGSIALGGPEELEARVDFDRNMTTNGPKDLTSWAALSQLLPPEAQEEDRRLYEKYQPRELDGTLTFSDANTWWRENLQLYVENETNIQGINDAAESVILRPGTPEFFQLCRENGIHATILSAGVHNVIEVVAKRYGLALRDDQIISTKLISDPRTGRIIDWERDSLIHILNKGEIGSPKLQGVRRQRPNTLVIGDAVEDVNMANDHAGGTVLRVRVGDPHKIPPQNATEYLEESFSAGYDMVRLGDFNPINRLTAFVIDAANQRKG